MTDWQDEKNYTHNQILIARLDTAHDALDALSFTLQLHNESCEKSVQLSKAIDQSWCALTNLVQAQIQFLESKENDSN